MVEARLRIGDWEGDLITGRQNRSAIGTLVDEGTMAWDEQLERRVSELTPASIREAMSRHIDVDEMAFMTGGDLAAASAGGGCPT